MQHGQPFEHFRAAVRRVQSYLNDHKYNYETLNFNGIYVTIRNDSNEDDLATIYDLKRQLQQHLE